ncbi:hypothetical protein CASFOL_013386 [Castilleja foliolosa]|uniref:Uncharacterized protein n=1 Tax=Castilleja foliolosa TaxID=1961234 RepID=A0ABD3DCV3_9LAMI
MTCFSFLCARPSTGHSEPVRRKKGGGARPGAEAEIGDGDWRKKRGSFLGLGLAARWSADYLRGCDGDVNISFGGRNGEGGSDFMVIWWTHSVVGSPG